MGGPYDPSGLNTPSPFDHNLFSNLQLPFLVMLDLPNLFQLTNEPILHNPSWSPVPTKIPFDIPKFDGKLNQDPITHITICHL